MRRPGNQDKTLERIRRWREICPDLTLRSTFIVGFPGETDEDFTQLLDWLDDAKLDRVSAFKYEPVAGAAANDLDLPPVPADLAESRYRRFMVRAASVSAKRLRAKVGRHLPVLDRRGRRARRHRSHHRGCLSDRRQGPRRRATGRCARATSSRSRSRSPTPTTCSRRLKRRRKISASIPHGEEPPKEASRTTRVPDGAVAGPPRGSRRHCVPPHHEANGASFRRPLTAARTTVRRPRASAPHRSGVHGCTGRSPAFVPCRAATHSFRRR